MQRNDNTRGANNNNKKGGKDKQAHTHTLRVRKGGAARRPLQVRMAGCSLDTRRLRASSSPLGTGPHGGTRCAAYRHLCAVARFAAAQHRRRWLPCNSRATGVATAHSTGTAPPPSPLDIFIPSRLPLCSRPRHTHTSTAPAEAASTTRAAVIVAMRNTRIKTWLYIYSGLSHNGYPPRWRVASAHEQSGCAEGDRLVIQKMPALDL